MKYDTNRPPATSVLSLAYKEKRLEHVCNCCHGEDSQGDSGGEEISETSARASSMFMTSVVSSK